MGKCYLDTETCGLHGFVVLIQYAIDDGPITIYDVWKHPISETLALIERLCEYTVVGFNLSFDWFHLAKCYTVFLLCPREWIPEEHIDEIALKEPEAQEGPCLKPAGALDLMLHARKGPYQSLMARDDVRIKKVPTALALALAQELEKRVELDGIYFAKSADRDAPRWKVFDLKRRDGEIDPNFKDVVLKFNPAGGLKFLAEYAMDYVPKYHYKDVEPDGRPIELGYAPTALAVSSPERNWAFHTDDKICGYAWPGVIKSHIEHWANRLDARDYASGDVVYTRALDAHFNYPEPNDDDSILACMVAVVRWHGFQIDIAGIRQLLASARETVAHSPINCNKPSEVRAYIYECMDDTEKIILEESTKKAHLESLLNWEVAEREECSKCEGTGCLRCNDGFLEAGKHPAATRAKDILEVKIAAKQVELYTKLLRAKKFHASFVVIGTLSSRMAGADGLNPQGIAHSKEIRRMFPLAWDGMRLSLGDFSAFEVTLADAVYNDPNLRRDLLSGKKIHALFGMSLSGKTYEEVCASKGSEEDWYDKGKRGVFALVYGGDWNTLVQKLGVPETRAKTAYEDFVKRYPGIEKARQKTFNAFCSMRQPAGIGSAVIWANPADYCETFLGFRRYFTLENAICRALFDLARKPPREWKDCQIKVVRRDRVQTAGGAVSSALYGAAFQMQAANMRAAANHEIQSPGAQITKSVQRRIWDLQPAGINDWRVAPINVHNEILCVHVPEMAEAIERTVLDRVESFREKVPLIAMDWQQNAGTWADK
ncbi:MAG: DNA polymerase [Thermoguttaceae bacterium]|jgi:hypothetical protein